MTRIARALTIAGSDSGGGAGIQADLKTFAALGVYGASVITVVTAQNTQGVTAIHDIPLNIIAEQIDAVVSDIEFTAFKTGMLSSAEIIELVADKVSEWHLDTLVVDPVMIAKGGQALLQAQAVETLRNRLIPLATITTPNLPEASVLVGRDVTTLEDARDAARAIIDMGAKAVVVKGGHLSGPAIDTFYDGSQFVEFPARRVDTKNTHGTGCTFASAIAAGLAKGLLPLNAVDQAKKYVTEAIEAAYPIGAGHGPVHHFVRWW